MMRKRGQIGVLAVVFMICTAGAARRSEAAVNIHEGEWETTVEMKMKGVPSTMPPIKTKQCITNDNMVPQVTKNCSIKSRQVIGNKVIWTAGCVDRGSTTEMQGEITYSGDSYNGNITVKERDRSGRVIVSTGVLTGRRIGDCLDKNKH